MHLEVTPEARDNLLRILEENPGLAIRLFVEGFG
jgi:Fe-S cluster assembly iron-binding protein IscA